MPANSYNHLPVSEFNVVLTFYGVIILWKRSTTEIEDRTLPEDDMELSLHNYSCDASKYNNTVLATLWYRSIASETNGWR